MDARLKDEILLTEPQKVAAVGSFRRGSEPKEKFWLEIVNDSTVCARSSMVELVDNDVVEVVWPEPREMIYAPQRLDRCE